MTTALTPTGGGIPAAFADPVLGAQATFRCLLEAMAHPGRIVALPPAGGLDAPSPLLGSTFAVALTLLDFETPLWLDDHLRAPPVVDALQFHCGCPIVGAPEDAAFALIARPDRAPPVTAFAPGTPEYPDRSTTVIVQVDGLDNGSGVTLRGPGIDGAVRLRVDGVEADFWREWATNHARFPLGIDVVFTTASSVAALPRSIRAET